MVNAEKQQPTSPLSKGFSVSFFFFLFFAFALLARGLPPTGDPVNYYAVAANLADRGTAAFSESNEFVPLERGRDGKFYSKFGPGQSLIEIPFYRAAKKTGIGAGHPGYQLSFTYFACELSSAAAAALACVFFLLLAVELGYSRRAAAAGALALAFCTMLFPYAKQGFSEPLQAAALAGAFLCAVRARARNASAAYPAACGTFLGILLLTKVSAAVVAPFFALYLIAGKRDGKKFPPRNMAPFALAFCVFAVLALYYNFIRFGDWFNFGYFSGHDVNFGFGTPVAAGLYGLLFSPGKSMFLYSPLLIATLFFARRFHRRAPAESTLLWCCSLATILLYARWWAWHGDWCWGPRFIVPLLPLLMLPVVHGIDNFRDMKQGGKTAFIAVAALALFIQIIAVSANFYEYIIIVRRQVPHGAFFMPGRPDLRDDQLYTHFVPDFSPLAGQWWLFKHLAVKEENVKTEAAAAQKDFPWRGLMAYAAPKVPASALEPDVWWIHFPKHFPKSSAWVPALRLAMLGGLLLAAAGAGFSAARLGNRKTG